MPRVILVLIIVGLTIYSLIDCLRTDDEEIRALPKPVWLIAIIVLQPAAGALLWIWLGIAREGPWPGGRGEPRVMAPDDDPDFLRSLNKKPRRGGKPPSDPEAI
jgi:Phospholipase_D-nuclease N-terminal